MAYLFDSELRKNLQWCVDMSYRFDGQISTERRWDWRKSLFGNWRLVRDSHVENRKKTEKMYTKAATVQIARRDPPHEKLWWKIHDTVR